MALWHSSVMDYLDIVTSLECEALEHPNERVGELCAQGAIAITALHNQASELQADIEDLLQEIATIKAARLRLAK
jgi:predicted transcriptional regulator